MNLVLPVVGTTPGGGSGTSWGPLLTSSIDTIDAHDHSPGKGAPLNVTAAQLNVHSDLDFGGHSIYDLNNITISGSVEASALSGSLTQISSGSYASGSWSGGVAYSGSFTPSGPFGYTGLPYLVGVAGTRISTNSLGQVIISGSLGGANYVTGLATSQIAVVTASVSASNLTKQRNGIVSVTGMLVVNPDTESSGSAQLYRDTTPVGASMALPLGLQSPTAFVLQWLDFLPDTAPHAYSMQVTSSAGTLAVIPGQGSITAFEH